jgi:indole-3-pyruvate monooxygenase
MENALVLIVGAGPSGLAMAGCLTQHSISYVILEREDCYASLWKKRTYDRLGLHLAKEFCFLPHRTLPPDAPTFMPKDYFLRYVDGYVSEFKINPRYHRSVQSAFFDEVGKKWRIEAKNTLEGSMEVYSLHSNHYKSGSKYKSKDVLVVGCGNSGMEIAYDLLDHGARTSIVIRSPVILFSLFLFLFFFRFLSLFIFLSAYLMISWSQRYRDELQACPIFC